MPITIKGDRFDFIDSNGNTESSLYMSNGVASVDGVPIAGGGSLPALPLGFIYVGDALEDPIATEVNGQATLDDTGFLTLDNSAVISKTLTGFTSQAGTVSSSDTILQAVEKLNQNTINIAQDVTGQLSQAQILDLSGNPVEILATPGSGLAYVVDEFQILHNYSSTVYAAGSDLLLKYGGGASISLQDSAFVTGGANAQSLIKPTIYDLDSSTGTSQGFDIASQSDKSITLTVAGADFTGGTAGNKLYYRLRYHTVAMIAAD